MIEQVALDIGQKPAGNVRLLEARPEYGDRCLGVNILGSCGACGGDGKVDKPINCEHNKSSSHSYCSHDKTTQHDD